MPSLDLFPPPRILADPTDDLHAVRRAWAMSTFQRTSAKDQPGGYPSLDANGRLDNTDMPLVLSPVRAGSVTSALTVDASTGAGNVIDLTITGNPTINISNGVNGQRLVLRLLASGADRTVTLGSAILEPPGKPSVYTIPAGTILKLELEYVGLRSTPLWWLDDVRHADGGLDPMPLGLVARRQKTSNTAASSSTTAIGVLWARCPVYAGRAYRVRSDGIAIASAASQVMGFRFTYTTDGSTPATSSTALETGYWHFVVSGVSSSLFHTGLYLPTTSHTLSVLFSFWRQSGSGTVTVQGNTGSPFGLIVEDLGPAPAVTGADVSVA